MEQNKKIPVFWKSALADIEETASKVRKGNIRMIRSAGGRPVYFAQYGRKNDFRRTANLSSASGCGDIRCYADKTGPDIRPGLFLVGAMHGAEFEGTVALLNLINILETGRDFAGDDYPEWKNLDEWLNIYIIPCLNPDGRARVPFESVCGMSFEDFRYYAQGTWKDGSLAGWPDCKKVHPISDAAGHLGGYYNDDGINIMHDDFFSPMAEETRFLLDMADEYVPDATVLLHGGTNAPNMLLQPACVPMYFKEETRKIALSLQKRCQKHGMSTLVKDIEISDNMPPVKMNAVTAVTMKCGELCMTYESNQGLDRGELILTHEEIYKQHMLLFAEMIEYVRNLPERRAVKIAAAK
ncbi:MAG: hypothetical protein J6N52_02700 [Clostridia bacterium]|nr:hypothetical protein [Clostridia bacterium]